MTTAIAVIAGAAGYPVTEFYSDMLTHKMVNYTGHYTRIRMAVGCGT
jgi:hypothetical protein